MARTAVAATKKTTTKAPPPLAAVRPKVRYEDTKQRPLALFRPNSWNPNFFTKDHLANLEHGFKTDGWIPSQGLLVWATDERGKEQNVIIDGEHRHATALKLGMKEGPVALVHGITKAEAMALTVKLDAPGRRGTFDQDLLGKLVREIQGDLSTDNLARDLAMTDDVYMKMLSAPPVGLAGGTDSTLGGDGLGKTIFPQADVRMVQLILNAKTHGEFAEAMKKLGPVYGTKNATDTAMEAIRRAVASVPNKG